MDDSVTVETVSDESVQHPAFLKNETPSFLTSNIQTIIGTVETYGWFILLGTILLVFLYNKYKPSLMKMKQQREEWKEEELNKKDPDRTLKIQLSMEEARLKLQQKVSADAEKKREVEAKREEEERRRKIEEWENHKLGRGYHNKTKSTNTTEKETGNNAQPKSKKKNNTMRSEFNALSGSGGGSCSYRPSGGRNTGGG